MQTRLAVNGGEFEARLTELDGQKLQKFSLPNAEAAARALAAVKAGAYRVARGARVLARQGLSGFYTASLFRYADEALPARVVERVL